MPEKRKARIALSNGNGYAFKSLKDLMYCVADGSYTKLYFTPDSKYLVTKSLGQIEGMISETHFIRIHKSHLVNMHFVSEVNNQIGNLVE